MLRFFICVAVLASVPVASAQALSERDIRRCNAMAATMAPKQAEITKLQEKRDALLATVEAEGELWDNAEAVRLFSAAQAEEADAAKAAYEQSKYDLHNAERALQAMVAQFNQDIASYNQTCATQN